MKLNGFVIGFVLVFLSLGSNVWAVKAISVAAGYNHTVALMSDGTVWAWGDNSHGQIGDGTCTTTRSTPVKTSITEVESIAAGYNGTAAIRNDEMVWTWGQNAWGQIGDGTTTNRYFPVQVVNFTGVVAVSAGGNFTVALKADGTVWAWGMNSSGELGDGTTTNRLTPVRVVGLDSIVDISAGAGHTVALKNDGTVWAWGTSRYFQVGDGTYIPVQVSGLSGIVAIAAGFGHILALKDDGTVWAWGGNGHGELGDGTTTKRLTPVQVQGLDGVIAVSAGWYYTAAIKSDGTVWTWGINHYGQLGDGTYTSRSTPAQVLGIDGVIGIAAGAYHTVALKNDGTVWAWGNNACGQLGNGNEAVNTLPRTVLGFEPLSTAKARSSESQILAMDCVVTGKFDDCIYVEDTNRLCGIKVAPAPSEAELGKLISIYGTLTTIDGEKAISLSSYDLLTDSASVSPLGMTNQCLGGGDFLYDGTTGEGQQGIYGWQLVKNADTGKLEKKWQKLAGINNIGLLVRVWGKVIDVDTASTPSWFKISDGSLNNVKVSVPTGVSIPSMGDVVAVTGISSCEMSGDELTNLVRVRQQSDIE
ncbi:RCC1 repeat-containing protein [bacterium]|nr:RCC1 repeat-containing protein [bacterium]